MAELLLDVVGLFTPPISLMVLILTGISIVIAFYKVIIDKAKMEQDLRNEIRNNENEINAMKQEFQQLMTEFKYVTQQLNTVADHGRRIQGMENMFNKIDGKMDKFSDTLQDIKISLERKQDKPR